MNVNTSIKKKTNSVVNAVKPKTKEIVFLEENALRGERAQDQPMSEKMGDGWRGSQAVGEDAQAVPVEEAV